MCKQIAMRWLFCNKVSSVNNSIPAGKEVTGYKKKGSDRDIGEKGSEGAVQRRTFSYFPQPRLKTWTFLCDGPTNRLIGFSMFQNLLWVWDGLDECEISWPEIVSQSAPGASMYIREIKRATNSPLDVPFHFRS